MIGSRSYPPIAAPPATTSSANPAAAIGGKCSSRRLPSVVSRQGIATPSGIGTSHATHAVVATKVIKAPHRGPNENGSRLAIQRSIATVAATATIRATSAFGSL